VKFLLKVAISSEAGNRHVMQGTLASTMKSILDDLKPEAAYFGAEDGKRTGYFFINVQDASEIPGIAEPLFLAFGAEITLSPVMTPQDLGMATPGIERAVKKYGTWGGAVRGRSATRNHAGSRVEERPDAGRLAFFCVWARVGLSGWPHRFWFGRLYEKRQSGDWRSRERQRRLWLVARSWCGLAAGGDLLRQMVQALVKGTAETGLELGTERAGVGGGQVVVEGLLAGPDRDDGEVIGAIGLLEEFDAQSAGIFAAVGDILQQSGFGGRQRVWEQVDVADDEQAVRKRGGGGWSGLLLSRNGWRRRER
jgi:hypothetical protein